MIAIVRTDASNKKYTELVELLDTHLKESDGDEHDFFAQYNSSSDIKYVVLAYEDETAVGCGAMKEYSEGVMEIKRLFVREDSRGQGIAARILTELENWAIEMSYLRCILETGKNQPAAIALYKKMDYKPIENFGQYAGVESSVCFEKVFVAG